MKAGPSAASRTAAVAKAERPATFMAAAAPTNRPRFSCARATPSGLSRPLDCMPRPSPHITFSLKIGVGARAEPSNTTRRIELEPISMTATRRPKK